MFALIDCNNFFASCEIVFNPKLSGKALGILSNNDGCVIARSMEAKKLGVEMGQPIFHYRKWIEAKKLTVLSSNFSLYADISYRVMQTLASFDLPMEIYSVDEAFIFVDGINKPYDLASSIRRKIKKWTGIPVSIGMAPTKTLAKIASEVGKKNKGIEIINDERTRVSLLKQTLIHDVWGIGRKMSQRLRSYGIQTAYAFASQQDHWIKKTTTVCGLKTALELRGTSSYSLGEEEIPKQSITSSRSFHTKVEEKKLLEETIASFIAKAAVSLREQSSRAGAIHLFIATSPFAQNYYGNSVYISLPCASSYTPTLIYYAKKALTHIYRPNFLYKKAGITLLELSSDQVYQQDLFTQEKEYEKKEELMHTIDSINRYFDKKALFFLSEGKRKDFMNKRENLSYRYTTQWNELIVAKAK